jgi:hypothetical protein
MRRCCVADEGWVRASNVIPFPIQVRTARALAPPAAVPFPTAKPRPFLMAMPQRVVPQRAVPRGLVDEFEIWSRRFGRRLVAAIYRPLLH